MAPRVRDNGRVLLEAYRGIASAIREERAITPAAEWLVDNFHVVEEQIREIRDDLPRGYYRQLPKLADGPLEGYPRVFGIAWAYVAHTDSHFDPQTLARFVQAYQRVQPLTIGELWAVAITLRIVLVENLRRSADLMGRSRAERLRADLLANRLLGTNGREAESPEAVFKDFDPAPIAAAFAVQLVQRLRDQDPRVTPALLWLDGRLAAQGTTADEIVRQVHQGQGAMNVTVRNVITSMRLMSAVDWADFFESVSAVDAVLRADSDFAAMDFATRDRYRHAIEKLARGSGHTEIEVAQSAIAAAGSAPAHTEASGDGATTRREHDPGYYLISRGRHSLEEQLGFRAPVRDWIARANAAAGIMGYLGTIAAVSAIIVACGLLAIGDARVGEWTRGVLAMLAIIPAMDAAVALVNRAVASFIGPATIPALELHDGVPPSLRTIVVMPTLLTTRAEVDEQIERLEVHYLASPDGELYFAILSDWADSATETAPGDDDLLGVAIAGIARLNQRHARGPAGNRFLLLHRRRIWDEAEGVWMGWERKRGKLHELNRLLRGATDTTFIASEAHAPTVPDGVRYVITLDADTRIPRGAARRMVGKMAHPLNSPRFDQRLGRVVEGHGVLQPRITASLPTGRDGSVFQRVFSSAAGIDPYAFAVSDVYQDLLDEGSYSGKGIYDVDVFEASLAGRVPDNTLLSHDLFEGTFARSGLVSDIELVEEFPSRYDVAAARQHRWARGDWQLLPWILGRAHGSNAGAGPTARAARRPILDPAAGPLENDRQPAPHAVRASHAAGIGSRMDAAAGGCSGLDRVHRRDDRDGADAPVPDRNHPAAPRYFQAQPYSRGRHGLGSRTFAARDAADPARASGVADERRDFAHALAFVRESSAAARVDDRGAGEAEYAARRSRVLRDDGRRAGARHRSGRLRRIGRSRRRTDRGAVRDVVDAVAGDRAMDKPGGADRRREAALGQ